jgi:hypothetical protein
MTRRDRRDRDVPAVQPTPDADDAAFYAYLAGIVLPVIHEFADLIGRPA